MNQPRSILAVVQARLSSTRLPGKVLRPVEGRPLIGTMLERLNQSKRLTGILVATSHHPSDDPLADYLNAVGIKVFRGDLNNVFDRFHQISLTIQPDLMVRMTADCPLIDPGLLDFCIDRHLDLQPEITATNNETGFPRGVDVEVFSPCLLDKLSTLNLTPDELEHVTLAAYTRWRDFYIRIINPEPRYLNRSHFRLCVDQPEDFELVARIIQYFHPRLDFTLDELYHIMEANPSWFDLNRDVPSLINPVFDRIAAEHGEALYHSAPVQVKANNPS
ncbi:MAG: glycosyltransferase family protein [Candidatus Delongbacteria bacterium]|nr:glycosyltransferase family protein [Candidatus Delongbacteria bacterium]